MIRFLATGLAGLLALSCCTSSLRAVPPPPPELKPLVDVGHVRFEFYDPAVVRYERPGRTKFYASYQWNFRYDVRSRKEKEQLRVTVLPKLDSLTAELDHVILLPDSYDNESLYGRSLVLHEFDHVAISTDPRTRRLVEHLLGKLRSAERLVPLDQVVNDALVRDILNEALEQRQEAVRQAIEFNNRRLDQLSSYGTKALGDRRAFFNELSTRKNLEEAAFPYLNEAADLLRRPDYIDIEAAWKKALPTRPATTRPATTQP
jgi:hypothetical protein